MSYYKNVDCRPVSVSISEHDSALVPPNHFVLIDPKVERRYDTRRLVRLGILSRCGTPSDMSRCISSDYVQKVEKVVEKSPFAEALTEFNKSTVRR